MKVNLSFISKILSCIICALCFAQTAFANGIEDTAFYKSNPKLQQELDKYWQAFLVAKIPDSNPGKIMAAQIHLAEVEELLEAKGVNEENFEILRAQAQSAYVDLQQRKEVRVSVENFEYLVEQFGKVTPKSMDFFIQALKNYGTENMSRQESVELFLNVMAKQTRLVTASSAQPFMRLAISYYLLAEIQNYIGSRTDLAEKINALSSVALVDFLQTNEGYDLNIKDKVARIYSPVLSVFGASGLPDVTETAKNLIDFYKTNSTLPESRGLIKNLYKSFGFRIKDVNLGLLPVPMLMTVVAGVFTAASVSNGGWASIHGSNSSVLVIWGLAFYMHAKFVFGINMKSRIQEFKTYLTQDRSIRRIKANKNQLIKSLEKTCKTKLQGK